MCTVQEKRSRPQLGHKRQAKDAERSIGSPRNTLYQRRHFNRGASISANETERFKVEVTVSASGVQMLLTERCADGKTEGSMSLPCI